MKSLLMFTLLAVIGVTLTTNVKAGLSASPGLDFTQDRREFTFVKLIKPSEECLYIAEGYAVPNVSASPEAPDNVSASPEAPDNILVKIESVDLLQFTTDLDEAGCQFRVAHIFPENEQWL